MTREEEIHIEYMKHLLLEGYSSNCFEYGAKWADEHPVNPWCKVSEELPEVPEKKTYIKVFATWPSGSGFHFFVLYYHKDFGFSKYKHYQNVYYKDQKEFPKHWMYIPEIKED